MKKKKPKNKKGVAGRNTGGTARRLIRSKAKCLTNKQIGQRIGRSASVVSAIKNGTIKNPPQQVITRLRRIGCKK